jgi:hypothetical protein
MEGKFPASPLDASFIAPQTAGVKAGVTLLFQEGVGPQARIRSASAVDQP